MDGAEVYLLMIRKSLLPILGEAMAPLPYFQQVEVLSWDWKLVNQEEVTRREKEDKETELKAKLPEELKYELDTLKFGADTNKQILAVLEDKAGGKKLTDLEKMRLVEKIQQEGLDKMTDEVQDDVDDTLTDLQKKNKKFLKEVEKEKKLWDKQQKDDEAHNLTFKFAKRVDFASTQMLNCMKAGELLPRVVLTVLHRSVTAPLLLTMTAKNLRFTNYSLSVEVDETMADMKEEWEAEFSEVSFLYSNRGLAGGPKTAAEALTTQQMRMFTMKSRE